MGIIPDTAESLDDLEDYQMDQYNKQLKIQLDSYRDSYAYWKTIIQTYMQYKKPNLVNTNLGGNLIDKGELFVYATFMKCGKQFYAIESFKPEKKVYVHSCIPKFRNEEIPKFVK